MKLLRIDLGDDDLPVAALARLTLTELHLLYNLTGRTPPARVTQAAGGNEDYGRASDDIARTLQGSFFSRFWESGADEVGPEFDVREIATCWSEWDATRR
jgi:hypothetical protein